MGTKPRKEKPTSVYFLRCPLTQVVKYIGTSNRPSQRYIEHLNGMCVTTRHWIRSLSENPVLDVIMTDLTKAQAEQVESRLQLFHRTFNRDLLPMNARYRVVYGVKQNTAITRDILLQSPTHPGASR